MVSVDIEKDVQPTSRADWIRLEVWSEKVDPLSVYGVIPSTEPVIDLLSQY